MPPSAGYGNRMYSMLSAFLIAVVTESALLIKWPPIDKYIDCPLVDTFRVFNDSSFLDYNQKVPNRCYVNTVTPNAWLYKKNLDVLRSNFRNRIIFIII